MRFLPISAFGWFSLLILLPMNILFLTTVLPSCKLHGSEIASQNIIDALRCCGCEVTILGYNRQEDGDLTTALGEVLVAERAVETKQAKRQAVIWFIQSLLAHLPYSAAKYQTLDYLAKVRSLVEINEFNAIIIDHSQLGWLLPLASRFSASSSLIFTAHNIEHEIYRQHQQRSSSPLTRWVYGRESKLIRQMEDRLAQGVHETWTLTDHDANYFSGVAPQSTVRVLSLPAAFEGCDRVKARKKYDVGIIGSWPWKPNEEGLRWFLEAVYPILSPDLLIHVAGRGADWLVDEYPNIVYRGFVADAQRFMVEAKVVVIPTLSGGGIQIKTLDAIASGTQIVGTAVALRGISDPPETVQVVEDPESFADGIRIAIARVDNQLESDIDAEQMTMNKAYQWYRNRQFQFQGEIAQAVDAIRVKSSEATVNKATVSE